MALRIEMSEEGKNDIGLLDFIKFLKIMKVPFVIYSDFESVLKKIDEDQDEKKFKKLQEHIVCGYGQSYEPEVYRGLDAAEHFLNAIQDEEIKINKIFKNQKILIMTGTDNKNYEESNKCWFCEKPFYGNDKKNRKVRDHCHLTGKYRGAAHSKCNLQAKVEAYKTIIPVVFHNLRGYDSHLIMQAVSKTKGDLKCIANNMEKYISFSLGQLRFIDSLQCLNASLDKLVESNDSFPITAKKEGNLSLRVHG